MAQNGGLAAPAGGYAIVSCQSQDAFRTAEGALSAAPESLGGVEYQPWQNACARGAEVAMPVKRTAEETAHLGDEMYERDIRPKVE